MAPRSLCALRAALLGGGAVAIVLGRRKLELWLTVAKYALSVFLIDKLPNHMRRRILSAEYSGDDLEERLKMRIFKGWPTVRALWRMSSVNLYPQVRVGDAAPMVRVHSLDSRDEMALLALSKGSQPLVLNFGSCT